MYPLAIVIPAYKVNYFEQALQSIALQTNKNFTLYIGDDASPHDLKAVVDKFANVLDIVYRRFDQNMGQRDLVEHWNRTVRLAQEEWIWLFSDDDILSPNCVDAFYKALKDTYGDYNLYRFDIEMIDVDDKVIFTSEPNPQTESAYNFLKRRLQHRCLSAAVEYVFAKAAFTMNNGFVNFPLAYCSDDASWIEFAGNKEIYTINQHVVYWRASGTNISSTKGLQNQKAIALLEFIKYIFSKFPDKKHELSRLSRFWFFESLKFIGGHLNLLTSLAVLVTLSRIFPGNFIVLLKQMILARSVNTRLHKKISEVIANSNILL